MATHRANSQIVAATAANGTLTKPTGTAAGDILLIFYSLEGDNLITPPKSFIITSNQDHASQAVDQFGMWKRCGGSEPANYVVTHASTWRSGHIQAIQNASATRTPHAGSANQGTSTTVTALGVTTEANDALVAFFASTFNDMGLITPPAGTTPTFTERWDSTNNVYVADGTLATAGATGDKSITLGVSNNWMARLFVVEDDGYDVTTPTVIQQTDAALSASRSPTVTFDFAPLENDIVALYPSSSSASAAVTDPSGWTNILAANTIVTSDAHSMCGVYHRVTAAEAAAVTVTFTATNLYNAAQSGNTIGVVIRNVDTTTAIDVTSSALDSANTASPHVLKGLTPTVTDGLFMSAVTKDATGQYVVPPSGFDMGVSNTNQAKAVAWRETLTTASVAIGDTNITPQGGDEYVNISCVWRKAAAGGLNVTLDPATLTLAGQDLVATGAGAASQTLDSAALTLAGQNLVATGVGTVSTALDTAALTLTAQELVAAPAGAATQTLDPAALTLTGQDLVPTATGTAPVTLDPATLTLAGQDLVATGVGTTSQALDTAALTLNGQDLVATGAGTAAVTLDIATLTLTGVDLDIASGAVTVTLDPAILTLAAQDLIATGAGAAAVDLDPAALTLTGIDFDISTGVATVTLDTAVLTLSALDLVAAGAGTVGIDLDPAQLTLIGVDLVPSGVVITALITCEVDGPALAPLAFTGPASRTVSVTGPATLTQVTGPALEVVSAAGPAIGTVPLTGPAVRRAITGPATETEPTIDGGPATSRTLTGPSMCPEG